MSFTCMHCLKDMGKIWDTVCKGCDKTFCYKHSKVINNHWYCPKCVKKLISRPLNKIEEGVLCQKK